MKYFRVFIFIIIYIFSTNISFAGVVIGGTRVVYISDRKEASISVSNPETDISYLIQSWVQDENNDTKVPFIITPPLFKLTAGNENILRIVKTGENLPNDKESIFWLNVKSIPGTVKSDQNQLQITVKSRFKLFYRPVGLTDNASIAYKALKFKTVGHKLIAENPTPYYISFSDLTTGNNSINHEIKPAGMISPYGQLSWDIPVKNINYVTWKTINDFGGVTPEEKRMF
ncbi:putative periplasmic chaperone protein with PapD-like and periplasmic chaperone C-domains [Xenorhabdus bovienii str. kraussei Quebec]|uniref:Putative periplasmic chaperone protein with PapD-like and periplasmic chaperone C-domains n=1 Tax=Xenorhabdus bovienii str. kraussei Quebec TaxID=1398203 RepID=A0A077PN40_XENBV|nr:molecular chaperone [Xenorhabdus bovienii]CDH21952.1 putative periplasmic chaperone protein with PapD-like and periplasmic chaperone C-domains [Xenorhabdus bovienii str. kraussei Quebec]